jgi:hypothetical protein
MSNRALMVILAAIAFGSLVLLFDSIVTSIATTQLHMIEGRVDQARFIYAFGAVGAGMGLVLVGFLDLSRPRRDR